MRSRDWPPAHNTQLTSTSAVYDCRLGQTGPEPVPHGPGMSLHKQKSIRPSRQQRPSCRVAVRKGELSRSSRPRGRDHGHTFIQYAFDPDPDRGHVGLAGHLRSGPPRNRPHLHGSQPGQCLNPGVIHSSLRQLHGCQAGLGTALTGHVAMDATRAWPHEDLPNGVFQHDG